MTQEPEISQEAARAMLAALRRTRVLLSRTLGQEAHAELDRVNAAIALAERGA